MRNYGERCFIMSKGQWLDMDDVFAEEPHTRGGSWEQPTPIAGRMHDKRQFDLESMAESPIREVLESTGGNQSRAAEIFGI